MKEGGGGREVPRGREGGREEGERKGKEVKVKNLL